MTAAGAGCYFESSSRTSHIASRRQETGPDAPRLRAPRRRPDRLPLQRDVAWTSINTLRVLAMDAVEQANSGHPGTPMALAPAAYLLWTRHLKHSPRHPDWPDRDRFVLSCGHASMLLYGLLHLTGYDLSLDDIRHFRQWGSRTPGHPERGHTAGRGDHDRTPGPGHRQRRRAWPWPSGSLSGMFNRPDGALVDHRTWVLASDGDLMEGVASEAASLAGHLRLGKLTVIYDDNHITIDGRTDLAFSESVGARFEAYGWRVLRVADGNDLDGDRRRAHRRRGQRGTPDADRACAPSSPTRPPPSATPPARTAHRSAPRRFGRRRPSWAGPPSRSSCPRRPGRTWAAPSHAARRSKRHGSRCDRGTRRLHPAEAERFRQAMAGELPAGWDDKLPVFGVEAKAVETRKASAAALKALAAALPNLVGGSADLAGSTGTTLSSGGEFGPGTARGRRCTGASASTRWRRR